MTARDGRNVDLRTGTLSGEASGQVTENSGAEGSVPTWERTPSQGSPEAGTTYFDLPVVKEPVWIWSVPAYFYVGGAAGASIFLGAVLQAVDRDRYEELISRCRRIGAAGTTFGTFFLVHDLGRPARFLNMLRVFRPTSAMSVGSWTLAAASGGSALAAALDKKPGVAGKLGDVAGSSGAITGIPLAGYTAVLLSDTAVPLWQTVRRSLPWLFISAGLSASADLLTLSDLSAEDEELVERLGIMAKIGELGATVAVGRDAAKVARVGRPLKEGFSGTLWRAAAALTATSLAISVLPGRSRARTRLSAVMGATGGAALRFAIFHAGKASARDPRATFDQQRSGFGAAEVTER